MPTNPQLRVAELDYDQILTNLITFMKADPTFSDYDFTGSGLRMLARVLAYVTYYNGVYLSSAVNEAFLDTAQLRSSVVAHARMLGYNTHGVNSARMTANVVVQLSDTTPLGITLPQHTQFVLQANNSFNFYNVEDATLTQNATSLNYEGTDVALVEGNPATYRFVVNLTDPTQRFVIPNANIDFGSLTLVVFDSVTSNVSATWQPANSFLLIEPTDKVFWVEEAYNSFPELRFGNGVVGAALEDGNLVFAEYFISRGNTANSIRGPFRILTANITNFLTGATDADANTSPSQGGADPQTLDDIRFLAPSVYQTQNRCVTAADYKAIILRDYGEHIAAINVFGGEQGDPNDPKERPILGKVFIALKPKIGLRFTDSVRDVIEETIVKPHVIVGTIPSVIDPDYVYVVVGSLVKYEPKNAPLTKLQLQQAISNNIVLYAEQNIEKFDTQFRFSRLTRVIDDTDESIVSSLTRLDLEKRVVPILGASNSATLKYGVPLKRGSESTILENLSHRFSYADQTGATVNNCFFIESNDDISVVRRLANGVITTVQAGIGNVDREHGTVSLNNFIPLAIENDEVDVRIRIRPAVNDFAPRLNLLYTVDATDLNIRVEADDDVTPDDQATFFQGGIL
jgi:hypothetical protein